ncbi:MAG: flippase-like domain-containing protein [Lachnospiraceae bacterium]|nr:flippase-like domain-containing protein [Lachnospiraceae bacterium]
MKKKVFWAVAFVIIAALSIWAVTSQNKAFSFKSFTEYVRNANPYYMTAAVLSAAGYIFFEGAAILVLLKGFGYKRTNAQGTLYSAADIYFSAITPSATGGQPASAYFMVKDGVPSATTTVVLLLNLIMYTTSHMVVGVVAAVFGFGIFAHLSVLSKVCVIIGLVVQIILTLVFVLLLRSRRITEKIGIVLLRFLKKIHLIRNLNKRIEKLDRTMDEFQACADAIADKKIVLVKAFFINLAQRICNISVSALVFLAGGGVIHDAGNIWLAQSFVAIGANSVPIPGAMGITDYLMIDAFGQFMGDDVASQLELLSRSLSWNADSLRSCALDVLDCLILGGDVVR